VGCRGVDDMAVVDAVDDADDGVVAVADGIAVAVAVDMVVAVVDWIVAGCGKVDEAVVGWREVGLSGESEAEVGEQGGLVGWWGARMWLDVDDLLLS